jgi:hypothetical protein
MPSTTTDLPVGVVATVVMAGSKVNVALVLAPA